MENGSFTKASKKVHLTQPTISGHIKALEDLIGAPLFDRIGREVFPTKAAELLYPYAVKLLELADDTKKAMSYYIKGTKGVLNVGGSNIPGQYILPALVGEFKEKEIQVTLKIGDTSEITGLVEEGGLELGVVGAVLDKPGLQYEPCCGDELILVIPKHHELAEENKVDVTKIRSYPFVIREKGSGSRMTAENALISSGYKGFKDLDVVAEMGSTEAILRAVMAKIGISIVSLRAVEDYVRHGTLVSKKIEGLDLKRNFYLIWRKDRSLSPIAKKFLGFLRGAIEV
jgi:DNA-binding transcriptional LysR family regulator